MAKKSDYLATREPGVIKDLVFRGKLIWRLVKDGRVNFFLKLLPIGALIYLVSPIDLLPGLAFPVVGALDDAAVLWLGATLFVQLCPDDLVKEHTDALQKVVTTSWRDVSGPDELDKRIERSDSEIPRDEP